MSANFEYYKTFLQVARCNNITAAANTLFLAQSTVSRTIQNLESELGCQLFIRTPTGVTLTEEGNILYFHIHAAVEHIETAERKLMERKNLSTGLLRIGASELTLEHYLLPYVQKLKQVHPGISVKITFSTPRQAIQDIQSQISDLAILSSPLIQDDRILTVPLLPLQYVLVCGSGFLDPADKNGSLQALQGYPFICMEPGTSVRSYSDAFAQNNKFTLAPAYEVGSMSLLLSMAKANLGFALVPLQYAQDALTDGSLILIPVSDPLPEEQIFLLRGKNIPQPPAAKVFSELIFTS